MRKLDEDVLRWCVGYEGQYAVSILGNVYSFKCGRIKKMKPRKKKNGYLRVTFYNGGHFYHYIHRLVAEAFVGKIIGMQIDHIDNNKENNYLHNLDVVTQQENIRRQVKDGLNAFGEKCNSKLKESDVIKIKKLLLTTDMTHREISEMFNVHRATISTIYQNKSWRHINVKS